VQRSLERSSRAASDGRASRPSWPKRLFFYLVTVALFLAFLELVLALVGIKPIVVEKDPYVGFASELELFVPGGDGRFLHTAPNKLAWFNDQTFPRDKGPETSRIFTLGGSVTYGRPFEDGTSFSGWLRTYLEALPTATDWEVINAGGISYASYRVASLMEELVEYEPDLFIIYSGHNEFLERRTYAGLIEEPEALTRTKLLLQRTRLWALVEKTVKRRATEARQRYELTGEVEELLESSAGLDYYFRDDEFKRQVLDHYRFNLQRMIRLARAGGAQVILVSIPVNEKDYSPFKSQHRDGITEAERTRHTELLEAGSAALERGSAEEARKAASEAVDIDPLHADGHYLLGRALQKLGSHDEAAASFARAIEEDVCPLRALAETNDLIFETARRENEPMVDFRSLLKERMREIAGHSNLGDELFLDHAHPTVEANGVLARALIERMASMGLLEISPEWQVRVGEGVSRQVLARVDLEALARSYKNLSKLLLWAGKQREAEKYVRLAEPLLADDWEVHYNAGVIQLEAGDFSNALESFQEAVRLNPQSAAAYDQLGMTHAALGDPQAAVESGERAVALDPEMASAWNNLGTSYGASGDNARALEVTREALRLDADFAEAHNNLGKVFFDLARLEEALASYEQAMELKPSYLDAMLNRGLVLGNLGRYGEAAEAFSQILEVDPEMAPAHLGRAKALLERGDVAAASSALEAAVQIDPHLVEAWELQVMAHVTSTGAQRAADFLEQGLAANPESARLHLLEGRLQAQQGNLDRAASSFLEATSLDPELVGAWIDLGRLRVAQGRPEEAVGVFRQALAVREDDDRLHHILAAALLVSKQPDEARAHLERALEINAENAGAAVDLASLYENLGRLQDALALYRRAAILDPQLTRAQEGATRLATLLEGQ
jgi:tetratricopeptide (TPR) repeat protein